MHGVRLWRRAQFPHAGPGFPEGARLAGTAARGRPRVAHAAGPGATNQFWCGAEWGAARRPQVSESPQAGGNCPVTTEAPRTRHEPLPGLPGKRQRTMLLPSQGGHACAEALLRARGSLYASSLWVGGKSAQLPGNWLKEVVVFTCVSLYLVLFKRLKMIVELKRWLSGQEQWLLGGNPDPIPTPTGQFTGPRTNASPWRTDALVWSLWALHTVVRKHLQAT